MKKSLIRKIPYRIFEAELPVPQEITSEMRTKAIQYAKSNLVNNVRMATGRFYTTSEYELRRQRILNTPLP